MIKKLSQLLKRIIVSKIGTWFYAVDRLPVGTHLEYFLKHRVKFPIQTVVDVGANVGKFSSSFHNHFQGATFYCLEPFSHTFEILKKNLKDTAFKHYQLALGEKSEFLSIEVNPETQSDTNSLRNLALPASSQNAEVIEVLTLDEFVLGNDLLEIDFLKIDTEGYDLQVLKGGIETLSLGKIKLILVECGFDPVNTYHVYFQEIVDFLINKDFALVGFFQTDIRKISKRQHFSNALFVHSSVVDKIK
jgi:FkbM family methyltransferase